MAGRTAALGVADCPAGYRVISGTANADMLTGTSGNDCILGYAGDDVILGKGGRDFLIGGDGADKLHGGKGNDTLHGEGGSDLLHGDADADRLVGGEGDDVLDGDGQADQLWGGPGDDALHGDRGNDALYGDDGDDALLGGGGTNTANGGAGIDACAGTSCEKPALTITGCTSNSQCASGAPCIVDFGLCLGCVSDQDADQVCDSKDGCPLDAAKTAPLQCGCGVAETDADADGTPNCNDSCASDPTKTAPGLCGCGTSDVDGDADGTPNCNDSCASDPAKTAPGVCGCGVSDVDGDADGTPNCSDGCASDAAKTAPGVCGCGVSDVDGDADGTPNCNDGCESDASKVAPGLCGCGVSDVDSDADGMPDCSDGCESDPDKIAAGPCGCGTPDSDSDDDGTANCQDGCPDDAAKVAPGVCGCGLSDEDGDDDGIADCDDECAGYPDDEDQDEDGVPDGCDAPVDCTEFSVGVGVHQGDAVIFSEQDLLQLADVTCVTGSIYVQGIGISSFAGLETLREIAGNLAIGWNENLSSLEGLEALTRVGRDLSIDGNPVLASLAGLASLTDVGGLSIMYNDSLPNLSGLESLEHVHHWLGISGNAQLADITAVYGLSTVGLPEESTFYVNDNPVLPACQALTLASQVGRTCGLYGSAYDACYGNGGAGSCGTLPEGFVCEPGATGPGVWDGNLELDGGDVLPFGGLTCVTGSLTIRNTSLTSLASLGALVAVGEHLEISQNQALESLDGLDKLREVRGRFSLWYNTSLSDVSALTNLTSIGSVLSPGDDPLGISDNAALSQCQAWDIAGRAGKSCVHYGYWSDLCRGNEGTTSCEPLPDDFACVPGARGPGVHDGEAWLDNDEMQSWSGVRCITGQLHIGLTSELSALGALQKVGGNLNVWGTSLTTLEGLSELTEIGGELSIQYNQSLESLAGLAALEQVGANHAPDDKVLHITDNDSLPSCAVWQLEQQTGKKCGGFCANRGTGDCGELPPDFACVPGAIGPGVFDGDYYDFGPSYAYTGVTCVTGEVVLYQSEISVLSTLQQIGGDLSIEYTGLSHVDDLARLTRVGGAVRIQYNPSLTNLEGLQNLESVGEYGVHVRNNPNLPACWAWMLEQNTGAEPDSWGNTGTQGCGTLPPDFACVPGARGPGVYDGEIRAPGYHDISEWNGLTCVTGNLILYDAEPTDLTAFSRLQAVGGELGIYGGSFVDVNSLQNVTSIGRKLVINSVGPLQSLAGLSGLTSVGSRLGEGESPLIIYNNSSLAACWVSLLEQQTGATCDDSCGYNEGSGSCSP